MPFGGLEIVVIAVIVLLLFGGSRIPKIARGLGSSVTEFRKGVHENDREEDDEVSDAEEERETRQIESRESENGEVRDPDDTGRQNGSVGG